jgi:hypothetical protein
LYFKSCKPEDNSKTPQSTELWLGSINRSHCSSITRKSTDTRKDDRVPTVLGEWRSCWLAFHH